MSITKQLAKHLRDLHFGGNWSCSNLKDQLSNVPWDLAIKQIDNANNIATLSFHISYYVNILKEVLEKKGLNGKDKEFSCFPIFQIKRTGKSFKAVFGRMQKRLQCFLKKWMKTSF